MLLLWRDQLLGGIESTAIGFVLTSDRGKDTKWKLWCYGIA